jgi:hypothetical protein
MTQGSDTMLSLEGALHVVCNDVSFEQYHLFHADARILNGYNLNPTGTPAPR